MLKPETGYRFRNWDESLGCRPEHFYRPGSVEEVGEIVRRAGEAGRTVRAVGAGHSWSPLVVTDDTLINLDKVDRIVSVNAEQQRVTVQAGIRIKEWFTDVVVKRELMELLVDTGYDLYQLPGLHARIDVVDDINRFMARVGWTKEELVAPYDRVLNISMPPEHSECEYAVPVERAAEAVELTRQIIEENDYHVNFSVRRR